MENLITVRDLKVRYLGKGSGAPFVLLHGFSFSADTWVEMGLFDLLAKEYRVYSFDMPYGPKSKSDKLDTPDRDEYAIFLAELLGSLDIHNPLLLGASISAEVVLRYLLKGYGAAVGVVAGPAGVKALSDIGGLIEVPLLAVWGDSDTISPPSNAALLKGVVKEYSVHILKGAGHACYLDKPDEFKMIVTSFLKKLTR